MEALIPILIILVIINLILTLVVLLKKSNVDATFIQEEFKINSAKETEREMKMMERFIRLESSTLNQLNEFNLSFRKNLQENFDTLNERMEKRIFMMQDTINNNLGLFNQNLRKSMNEDFKKLNDRVEHRLLMINEKVNERLEQGFEKTNQTFTNILERLSKIDEAQKKIDSLSLEIISLQDVLTDKKARGTYGEVQLHQILATVFGEKNNNLYQLQYTFTGGVRADAVLFAPLPLGTIAIDSKFPLDNYRIMIDKTHSEEKRNVATKLFNQDVKKHIDAIASKYIIKNVTSDQAFMFIPAEAVFAELNAYHPDVLEYAYKKRVWLVSPTTLMSTLTTVQAIIINMERNKYASIIHEELGKLELEFTRYKERWDKLSQHIDTVSKDVKEIHVTTDKIGKRFESINQVDRNLIEQNN